MTKQLGENDGWPIRARGGDAYRILPQPCVENGRGARGGRHVSAELVVSHVCGSKAGDAAHGTEHIEKTKRCVDVVRRVGWCGDADEHWLLCEAHRED